MKPQVRIFIGIATSVAFLINTTTAQEHSQVETLNEVLRQSVCERIGGPLVFSTRDTLFALSLPTDEPATIYLQLTVGRNGKVKEKQTKIHANHMAQYVAPAFVEAAKELRIDRELLAGMQNKDTSLLVAFPMEYQCVYDTINKEWPGMYRPNTPFSQFKNERSTSLNSEFEKQKNIRQGVIGNYNYALWLYKQTLSTKIWHYITIIKD